MALNFPSSPTNGQVYDKYIFNSTKNTWEIAPKSTFQIALSDVAPTVPVKGDMWFDTASGTTYAYYEDIDSSQWVQIIGSTGEKGEGVDAGGTAGQILMKDSLSNFDTSWQDPQDIPQLQHDLFMSIMGAY